jgi:hypothetical protein
MIQLIIKNPFEMYASVNTESNFDNLFKTENVINKNDKDLTEFSLKIVCMNLILTTTLIISTYLILLTNIFRLKVNNKYSLICIILFFFFFL